MDWSQLEMTSGPKDFKFWSSRSYIPVDTMCRSMTVIFPPEIDGHDKRAELNFLSFDA